VKAPWFELKRLTVTSLARLQQQYGALVPALAEQKLSIESGAIYANAAGTFDGKTIWLARPLAFSVPSLTLSKDGRRVLNREAIRGSLSGSVTIQPGIGASLTELSVATESDLFRLAKAGDAPLTFAMGAGEKASLRGSGVVALAANLARLSSIAQALGAQPAPDQPQLRSGLFDGTVRLVKADRPQTDIQFDATISALTIQAAGKNAIDNEQLTIALTASAPDDLRGAAPIAGGCRAGGTGPAASAAAADHPGSRIVEALDRAAGRSDPGQHYRDRDSRPEPAAGRSIVRFQATDLTEARRRGRRRRSDQDHPGDGSGRRRGRRDAVDDRADRYFRSAR